jgi:DNA modification methylase
MELRTLQLSQLKSHPRNPRRIEPEALDGLKASIEQFGYVEPIIWNERSGHVVGGHQRIKALSELGRDEAEAVVVDLSESDELALNVALNSRHIAGDWTPELAPILDELEDLMGDRFASLRLEHLRDDLSALAFSINAEDAGDVVEDEVPPTPVVPVTQPGDIWTLGSHRLVCGDSTNSELVLELTGGQKAALCFTDPPWNVAYGSSQHPSWKQRPIANDDLGDAFPEFCSSFCNAIRGAVQPGAALYLVMSAQEWPVIDATLRGAGFHWSSTIIWAKDSPVLSRKDYHTQYEPIWYGWQGDAPRLNPVTDRTQSDVWQIPRPRRSEEHPTMKPVELVARALTNSSGKGDLVFEPFAGSGTTLVAAQQTGRTCYAVELEPAYVDVICARWEALTGEDAVRESDGVTFSELKEAEPRGPTQAA